MIIQAILFDLDNTLTHREKSIESYANSLLREYTDQLFEHDLQKIIQIIHRIDHGGYPLKEHLTHPSIGASVAFALIQELEWKTVPDFELLTEFWFARFGEHAVEMEGAKALLHALKNKKYKLAVVSNGGHKTRLNILNGLGLAEYFDEIISSELIGVSKPNAEIFLETQKRLGIPAQHCLFVGDHPINDIQGALNAGMNAVLIEGFHVEDTEPYQHRIKQLNELWSYL